MKASNILETIGDTPHVKLNRIFDGTAEVWIKLEKANPAGSIKDRIALAMVEDAEKKGILKQGSIIIEPTSGNTGVGLAMVAAVKGYEVILVMPESFSVERRRLMAVYGARFELTPREKGMKGAIEKAQELAGAIPGAWIASQFDNPSNTAMHSATTAAEILRDFPEGFDYLITGVGTGGHITGVGRSLKGAFPALQVFAVEPERSAVISGEAPGPHPIQGIGAGFIPGNLHREILDGVIRIGKEEAYEYAGRLAKEEGIFAGISTGASLAAIAKKIPGLPGNSRILTFAYDTGERYLSVEGLY